MAATTMVVDARISSRSRSAAMATKTNTASDTALPTDATAPRLSTVTKSIVRTEVMIRPP
jgi:hypothetical protein